MSVLENILRTPGAAIAGDETAIRTQLRQRGLPAADGEHWRYANLRALERVVNYLPPAPTFGVTQDLPALPGFERLVVLDGRLSREQSSAAAVEWLTTSATSLSDPLDLPDEDSRFALLASLFAAERITIAPPPVARLEIVFFATGAPGSVYPHLAVKSESGHQLCLVERHLGAPATSTLVCTRLQLEVARDAAVTHYRLQTLADHALWLDTLSATLAERAAYHVRHVAAGADTARSSTSVLLAGAEAQFSWKGLAAARGRQTCDFLVRCRHLAAHTRAEQIFRGIAGDQARVGFNADVIVTPHARGSRVLQSLRGLIDGKGAAVNLRPRLTIDTDDIQASHGATVGQLDENLLFYLLSRGLDRANARALLQWAFLGDVLATIEFEPLRREAEHAAAGHLAEAPSSGVLS